MVTAIDGYQMAHQGRAGQALATAALGSFFAGTVASVFLALFAPPLAEVALELGPAEYFSLMVLGLVASVALASGSLLKAFTMIVLGLLLGRGPDVESGTPRYASICRSWPTGSTSWPSPWASSASARSSATSSTSRPAA